MQPFLRLEAEFDPVRLKADLNRVLQEDYVPHFNTAYYSGDWSVVPLRSVGGKARQIYPDPTAKDGFSDTLLLDNCPYIREVLGFFQCPQQAVRLMRLKPGSVIKEHRDLALAFDDGEVRFHIPVRTNPDVDFMLAGQRVVMKEGECWYLDFTQPHSVANRGTEDRVHLVVDCVVNDWLRELMLATSAATRVA
jgi:mannose-6-phosphate isomerase-like protein (cupin superfamily)